MPVKCQTVISILETAAPKRLAEDWDNVGLQVGNPSDEVTGILVALDVGRETIREAEQLGANLVISHHPLIFKPLKNLRSDLPQGSLITDIVKKGMNIYCAHTNLDSAIDGVNQVLAEMLQLQEIEILNPEKSEKLFKIVVFIPETHTDSVREAMTKAGAGWIGKYSDCTFSVPGIGTFKAGAGCDPFLGKIGVLERAQEVRMETIIEENQINRVIKAMLKAHPYEEVAYDLYPLANTGEKFGLGRVGRLPEPVKMGEFLAKVKRTLQVSNLRYSSNPDSVVTKVAVCGGSGAGLISKAAFAGADVFVTGDVKYHEVQEAQALGIQIVDAGHFATERPIIAKIAEFINDSLAGEKFSVPVHASTVESDPFKFF